MLRRLTLVAAFIVSASTISSTQAASHGPARRGLEIDHNTHLSGGTSYTVNSWRWMTVGLRPGLLTVHLRLTKCGRSLSPACGLILNVRTPRGSIATSQIVCSGSNRACGKTTQITYQVPASGVYYVVVGATGAENVRYTIDVKGNIYPLHCTQYC